MLETLGARLRQRREEQGIALTTIAGQTKIKLSLLEALERDDVSHWPSGIFRRAFIRAYAHAVSLDPDVVVREFLELYPEPAELVAPVASIAAAADGARVTSGPPTRLRYIVGAAIGSLSRVRRDPDGVVAADGAPVHLPSPAESLLGAGASSPAPRPLDRPEEVVGCSLVTEPASADSDLMALSQLCTELGRVADVNEVQPLLEEAARILDAIGLIVWAWDAAAEELAPVLASGYSDRVLAQLPTVSRDADNATAAAFRSAESCTINGSEHASGALVVPLLTPAGCAGVLAIELQHGSEQAPSVRAVATIVAAMLAQLIGGGTPAQAGSEADAVPPVESFPPPIARARRRR